MGTVSPEVPVPAPCELLVLLLLLVPLLLLLPLLPQPAAIRDATASPRAIFMGRGEVRAQVLIIDNPSSEFRA